MLISSSIQGGGGGGSFLAADVTNPLLESGVQTGNGYVTISYEGPAPTPTPEPASAAILVSALAAIRLARGRRR